MTVPGAPKKKPLRNFADFSRTIKRCYFYALDTHSVIRKSAKFHYLAYRIDKIMLLLNMAT